MLWHFWLGDRKGIQTKKTVLVCWWWRFDWSFAYLIAPVVITTSIILRSSKIQNGDFLVPDNPDSSGKWLLKWKEIESCHSAKALLLRLKWKCEGTGVTFGEQMGMGLNYHICMGIRTSSWKWEAVVIFWMFLPPLPSMVIDCHFMWLFENRVPTSPWKSLIFFQFLKGSP